VAADWEGIAELRHEDAVLMPIDAPPVSRRDAIRSAFARIPGREGGVELGHLSVEVLEAEAAGDLVCVGAAYRHGGTVTADGREVHFEQEGSYVNILRRGEGGAWRICRQIINRDHPQPDPGPSRISRSHSMSVGTHPERPLLFRRRMECQLQS
jgi:ketosteroid isomerase-like protein